MKKCPLIFSQTANVALKFDLNLESACQDRMMLADELWQKQCQCIGEDCAWFVKRVDGSACGVALLAECVRL